MHRSPAATIAHRGASGHVAEHTVAAFDLALAMGADALELDVRLTADGELVVLHDETLARTAGDPRPIACLDAAELGALDEAVRPLTLGRVLARYGDETSYWVELKQAGGGAEERLAATVAGHGLADRVGVQSFDGLALRRLRRLAPELRRALIFWSTEAAWAALGWVGRLAGALAVPAAGLGAPLVAAAQERGLAVNVWTVNDEAEMDRVLALGVDGVITDLPDRLQARLAASLDAAAGARSAG